MIKAGSSFFHNGKRGTIGAVISLKGVLYAVTVSHIFGGGVRALLTVEGKTLVVTRILKDHYLALIEIPPGSKAEITEFGSPGELELAELINDTRTIHYCRIANSGASLLFLGFPMPRYAGSGGQWLSYCAERESNRYNDFGNPGHLHGNCGFV